VTARETHSAMIACVAGSAMLPFHATRKTCLWAWLAAVHLHATKNDINATWNTSALLIRMHCMQMKTVVLSTVILLSLTVQLNVWAAEMHISIVQHT
jgi:hypothetical protein